MRILFATILIAGMFFLFAWTAMQNFVLGGVFEAQYNFEKELPFITPLSPRDRVTEILRNDSGESFQKVYDDPVYFRVRAPRSFDRATVTVRFKKDENQKFALGGLVSWEDYKFDLQPLDNIFKDGDWQVATVNFNLSPLFTDDGRTYTFVLSLPGIAESGSEVAVQSIWVRLERPR